MATNSHHADDFMEDHLDDLLVTKELLNPIKQTLKFPVPEFFEGKVRYRVEDSFNNSLYLEDGGTIELARISGYCFDGLKFTGLKIRATCFAECTFRNAEFVAGEIRSTIFEQSECSLVAVDTALSDVRITAAREGSHLRLHRARVRNVFIEQCRRLALDLRFSVAEKIRISESEIVGGAFESSDVTQFEVFDATFKNFRAVRCRAARADFSSVEFFHSYLDLDLSLGVFRQVKFSESIGKIVADFSSWSGVYVSRSHFGVNFTFSIFQHFQVIGSRIDVTGSNTALDAVAIWRCEGVIRLTSSRCFSFRANDSVLSMQASGCEFLAPTCRRSRLRGWLKETTLTQAGDARALSALQVD